MLSAQSGFGAHRYKGAGFRVFRFARLRVGCCGLDKERVLFIGEGSRSREMVALLEGRRYDVFHALDLNQANDALEVQRFGLIVCDPSISLDRLRRQQGSAASGWLVELHDSDAEPSLQRRSTGDSTEAVIAGLGNLDRVTDLLDRLLVEAGDFVANPQSADGLSFLSLPLFDGDKFRRQMHDDPSMMSEIIRLYLKETKHQVRELDTLVRHRDASSARRVAHTLKGSFGAVFASRAGAVALAVETAMVAGDFGLATDLLAPLTESAEGAEIALDQFLDAR